MTGLSGVEVDISSIICSVSTSLATWPSSDIPLFKYLVPAKCLFRLAITVTARRNPYMLQTKFKYYIF